MKFLTIGLLWLLSCSVFANDFYCKYGPTETSRRLESLVNKGTTTQEDVSAIAKINGYDISYTTIKNCSLKEIELLRKLILLRLQFANDTFSCNYTTSLDSRELQQYVESRAATREQVLSIAKRLGYKSSFTTLITCNLQEFDLLRKQILKELKN